MGSAVVVLAGADDVGAADSLGSAAAVLEAADDVLADVALGDDAAPVDDDVVPLLPVEIPLPSSVLCTCCCTAWTWARISAGEAFAPSAEIASSLPSAALSFACSSADGCCDTVTTIW